MAGVPRMTGRRGWKVVAALVAMSERRISLNGMRAVVGWPVARDFLSVIVIHRTLVGSKTLVFVGFAARKRFAMG